MPLNVKFNRNRRVVDFHHPRRFLRNNTKSRLTIALLQFTVLESQAPPTFICKCTERKITLFSSLHLEHSVQLESKNEIGLKSQKSRSGFKHDSFFHVGSRFSMPISEITPGSFAGELHACPCHRDPLSC